jgi:uncharacterized metal-binding protein
MVCAGWEHHDFGMLGGANAGQFSGRAASEPTQEEFGKMFSLAGIEERSGGLAQSAIAG